ncbi:ABC-2 transporter permease [Lysinibacillus sp. NPDC097231]|uniref:ABC-2 transporter permease n=1 Tax=Lysinibacillus sp. NPDC097231 TaxID=3364142 RepID=UPI0037F5FE8C
MFNLIRRDAILQKRQILIIIPLIVIFIIMDKHPSFTFLIASIIIPFNTFAYDEKVETNILLNSLPYTRMEIIASRYIGAIVYMIASIGVTSLALFIFKKPFTMTDIAIAISLFLLFVSFTFPLFYIFKQGYISMVIFISFILLAAIGPAIVSFLAEHLTAITDFITNLSIPTLYIGVTLVIMVCYFISWGITTVIYQRKAF